MLLSLAWKRIPELVSWLHCSCQVGFFPSRCRRTREMEVQARHNNMQFVQRTPQRVLEVAQIDCCDAVHPHFNVAGNIQHPSNNLKDVPIEQSTFHVVLYQ